MADQAYEPRGAARELLLNRDSEILICGAAGTGKSLAAGWKTLLTALLVPGSKQLILRQTHVSLVNTTLVLFREQILRESLESGEVRWHGGSGERPAGFYFRNGSTISVGGLDQPGKLLSAQYDRCFVDEADQVTQGAIDVIKTRLRNSAPTYKQLILACNPSAPSHPLKKRVDAGQLRMLTSVHTDNPYLFGLDGTPTEAGRNYMAILDGLDGVMRDRYYLGKWVAQEGTVFHDWREDLNVIQDVSRVPSGSRLFLSVDFGYSNPFVCQWWRVDGDGRMYLTREIHKTHTLVEDHAREIKRILLANQETEGWPEAVVCDHDAEDRATLTRHLGLATVAARKGVSRGVQLTQNRIRPAGDGKPRLYVVRDSLEGRDDVAVAQKRPRGFLGEVTGYVWGSERGLDGLPKEAPVKLHDHSMDAARYAVAYLDWSAPSRKGNPAAVQPSQPRQGSKWGMPVGR